MNAATRAPAVRTSAAAAIVWGSVAVTPNNWDWTSSAERGDTRQCDRDAGRDHGHGVAKDEPDG